MDRPDAAIRFGLLAVGLLALSRFDIMPDPLDPEGRSKPVSDTETPRAAIPLSWCGWTIPHDAHDFAYDGETFRCSGDDFPPDNEEDLMASTRCKFRCNSILPINPTQADTSGVIVNASAVMSDDPESENGKFWTATPSGQITLWINNPAGAAVFEQGKDYYVDFTPAA